MWTFGSSGPGATAGRLSVLASLALAALAAAAWAAGPEPRGTAGPFGFVGNSGDDTLTVIDLGTGTALVPELDLLPEGNYPYDVTIRPGGAEVWICGAVGDGVVVVDAVTHTISERISLVGSAEYPVDVAFNADGSVAYVSGRDSDAVAVIDADTYTVTGTIPITTAFLGPGKMAFSSARNELYVVEWFDDELYVIDAATGLVTPVSVGDSLWDLVLDPTQSVLYLADRGTDEVHVFDLDSLMVTASVAVGDDPWGIDVTPGGELLVVADEDSSEVSVVDTANLGVTPVVLPVGADPRDVDIAEDGSVAYVPSGDVGSPDAVYVLDLGSLMIADTIEVGGSNPNALAVATEGGSSLIFTDGFESGDTSAWSAVSP